ncbi:MAG: hypothetical protein QOE69_2488, partial [Thermoleophilaceae bacterium]|nr:hypothetical protein [Thermoleophilaceae bacterium]
GVDSAGGVGHALAHGHARHAAERPRTVSQRLHHLRRRRARVDRPDERGHAGHVRSVEVEVVRTVARKPFRIGSSGRTTVKLKPNRAAMKQLRRKRKLKLKAKAVLKNAAGQTSSRTATITLRLRRR